MEAYAKKYWPRVTNPNAAAMVGTCFTLLSQYVIEDGQAWRESAGPAGLDYQESVRWRLKHSGLAQMLPAGLDLLPDYYGSLAPLWAPLARITKPRTYRQLTYHFCENMEWYLEPTRPAVPTSQIASLAIAVSALPGLAFYIAMLSGMLFSMFFMWAFILIPVTLIVVLVATRSKSRSTRTTYQVRRQIHAIELFRYLIEQYSDPVETKEAQPPTGESVANDAILAQPEPM
jgi:hypothetical protein